MAKILNNTDRRPAIRSLVLFLSFFLLAGSILWDSPLLAQSRSSRSRARRVSPPPEPAPMLFFSIQVASLARKANAEALFKTLGQLGYDAYMEPTESGHEIGYKLKVGKYRDISEMEPVMARLRKDGFTPVIAQYKEVGPSVPAVPEAARPANLESAAASAGSAETSKTTTAAPTADNQKKSAEETRAPAEAAPAGAGARAPRAEKDKEEAASDAPVASGEDSFLTSGSTILHTISALAFVVALILGAYYVVKRIGPERLGKRGKGSMLRALDSMPLGEKKSLMVVEVDGDKYLLASTASEVVLLSKLGPAPLPRRETAAEPPVAEPDFATLLSLKKAELSKASAAAGASSAASEISAKIRERSKSISL